MRFCCGYSKLRSEGDDLAPGPARTQKQTALRMYARSRHRTHTWLAGVSSRQDVVAVRAPVVEPLALVPVPDPLEVPGTGV